MPNVASEVLVGKPLATGGILWADADATLPTDTNASPVGFTAGGYVSEDGVTQTIDTDTTDIKAWGGDVVRRIQTSHTLTYQLSLIQTNDATLAVYYGDDNVTAGVAKIVAGDLPHKKWIVEVKDGDSRVRICLPDGQVTDRGDVVFVDDDAIKYDITITCFPDDTGTKAYLYSDVADES